MTTKTTRHKPLIKKTSAQKNQLQKHKLTYYLIIVLVVMFSLLGGLLGWLAIALGISEIIKYIQENRSKKLNKIEVIALIIGLVIIYGIYQYILNTVVLHNF